METPQEARNRLERKMNRYSDDIFEVEKRKMALHQELVHLGARHQSLVAKKISAEDELVPAYLKLGYSVIKIVKSKELNYACPGNALPKSITIQFMKLDADEELQIVRHVRLENEAASDLYIFLAFNEPESPEIPVELAKAGLFDNGEEFIFGKVLYRFDQGRVFPVLDPDTLKKHEKVLVQLNTGSDVFSEQSFVFVENIFNDGLAIRTNNGNSFSIGDRKEISFVLQGDGISNKIDCTVEVTRKSPEAENWGYFFKFVGLNPEYATIIRQYCS